MNSPSNVWTADMLDEVELDYNMKQWPRFEDAYVVNAVHASSGRQLTDPEIDAINEDIELVYELVYRELG